MAKKKLCRRRVVLEVVGFCSRWIFPYMTKRNEIDSPVALYKHTLVSNFLTEPFVVTVIYCCYPTWWELSKCFAIKYEKVIKSKKMCLQNAFRMCTIDVHRCLLEFLSVVFTFIQKGINWCQYGVILGKATESLFFKRNYWKYQGVKEFHMLARIGSL